MANVKVDLNYTGISEKTILEYKKEVKKIHESMQEKKKDPKEMLRLARLANEL